MVKKKIDPVDGCAYSLAELEAHYARTYKKKDIQKYWETDCTPAPSEASPKVKAKAKAKGEASKPAAKEGEGEAKTKGEEKKAAPVLRRTRSWLKKVCGIALLPCEEQLAPLLEQHAAAEKAEDFAQAEAVQLELLRAHPFVTRQAKEVPTGAVPADVTVEVDNFRLSVGKFRSWLKTSDGRPFEEKGKGFDDGLYLTSGLLRRFLPRGYTHFCFSKAGQQETVVLRGFLKFTGLTAQDEDEESNATAEAGAFLFHGYSMEDAQRFLVTTKSNGENGKYTFRRVFGEWYAFAGSKNTGYCWRLFGTKATELYPIPELDAIAGVGPKIISFVDETISSMEEKQREELLENVQKGCVTVMVELNDETHEHIFPIDRSWVDHVAILNRQGFPWPQHDAYAFFDAYGLRRVKMEAYGMERLSGVMDEIRQSTDTEGAVLYLERSDGLAVGLVKVKSDHYVIARRTREILRSLVKASEAGGVSTEMLRKVEKRLKEGMAALSHVGGCSEKHSEWSKTAVAFTKSWADAYESADSVVRKALAVEFHCKYGSMYERFWRTGSVMPLSSFSLQMAEQASPTDFDSESVASPATASPERPKKAKGRRKGR